MKSCEKSLHLSIAAIVGLAILILGIIFPSSEAVNLYVYGPNENPYGKTYQEYAQMHWNAHVNLDLTKLASSSSYKPQECFFMKIDNKIFLQDFYSEINRDRSFQCTIPQLPVVIPALTEGCSYADYKNPVDRNDKKIKECTQQHNPYAVVRVTIDGEVVKNIDDYRKTSDFFLLNITNPKNLFDNEVGSWRAMIDAVMVVVDLPVGEHDIQYEVFQKVPELEMPRDALIKTDVKYHLTVQPIHATS